MLEPRGFRAYYTANEFALRRALLDLAAFLEAEQVAPAHVARISAAAGEVLSNVQLHAYGDEPLDDDGFTLRAAIRGRFVRLSIEDDGVGFDVGEVRLESVAPALPRLRPACATEDSGLVRVSRLCESLELTSTPHGSTAELAFELTLSAIDPAGDDSYSMSVDAFHPRRLRPLVTSLRTGAEAWERVPPALTLTLNRLLGEAHASRETVAPRHPVG